MKKTKVLNLTPQQALAEVLKGPPMTEDELAAQVRRNANSAARAIGLTPEEVRVAMLEFPIPSEEQKVADEILDEAGRKVSQPTNKRKRRRA